MWKTAILSKIRAHKIAATILVSIAICSSILFTYAFTGFLSPPGTCPEVHWGLSPTGNGPMPFQIVASEGPSLTSNPYSGTGLLIWCIYTTSGVLKESYRTDSILEMPSASADGSYVVVPGVRILPGPAGIWANGTVYLFNNAGRMLWKFSTPDGTPIFTASLNHNASVILANNPGLYYLNHDGKLLWTGSGLSYASIGPALLIDDGLQVVVGIWNNNGSHIIMFDNHGKILWSLTTGASSIFDSSNTLAVSDNHIAAGTSVSGYNGTLYYLDLSGNQIWSRHVNSAILDVRFVTNGLAISVHTNWGTQTFDLNGNQIT